MKKLTLEQAIIISGYTGITACKFHHFHHDVEQRLGRPIYTHEFADPIFFEKIKDLYREDFLKLVVEE